QSVKYMYSYDVYMSYSSLVCFLVLFTCYSVSFFFFFQAEDGIRDRNVTGVQTCALPISMMRDFVSTYAAKNASTEDFQRVVEKRSEERRVGKGVDLGGRRISKKKKKKNTKKDSSERQANRYESIYEYHENVSSVIVS